MGQERPYSPFVFPTSPREMPSCCISHEFLISATKDPRRVAIVQADGSLQLFRESRARLNEASSSSSPLIFPGDERFTYEDLLSAVDSLSRRIRCALDGGDAARFLKHPGYVNISAGGLDDEDSDGFGLPSMSYMPHIVGVRIGPSVEYIVAVLSILRCGEAFLPLDPSWPEERILSVVSSSRTRLVIKCGERQMGGGGTDWVVDGHGSLVLYFSMNEKFVKNVAQVTNLVWPCESNRQRKFCYLMYTSGSTEEPKGICGTELAMGKFNQIQKAMRERIQDRKRTVHGDPNTRKLKQKVEPIPISGKRKRKLFKKWRREKKTAVEKGLMTMEDIEMEVADGTSHAEKEKTQTKIHLKKASRLRIKRLKAKGKGKKKSSGQSDVAPNDAMGSDLL